MTNVIVWLQEHRLWTVLFVDLVVRFLQEWSIAFDKA